MARLFIPPQLRTMAASNESIEGDFATVEDALAELGRRFPAVHERLVRPDGRLAPGWAVVVDGVVAPQGLWAPLLAASELHILPALGGG